MRVLIRAATPDDATDLVQLCRAHAEYEGLPYQAEGHALRLGAALADGRVHVWLLMQDGQAAGYAAATLDFATLSARPFLHLDCLYVDDALRGQGWGSELMATVRRHARTKGCGELQWQTPAWNEGAIRFYDRSGATGKPKQRYVLAI
ncbi:MAG: GNAT family N-acetyltransferase [Pseudomonadota bacterium]